MKRFVAVFLLAGGLLVAGGASATSVTWTIPTTALTSDPTYTSVYGTFDWDAVNQVVSNVSVYLVVSGTPTRLTSSSTNLTPYIVLNNASPSTGDPSVFIDYTSLTNTATPATVSAIFGGGCLALSGNCINLIPASSANNVTLSPSVAPAPAAVPTLSEWSQMLLGLLVMTLLGWHFHKQRSY